MTKLGLSVDEVLTTTRSVRKRLDLDRPVPIELVHELLEVAMQAPTGSNMQGWHWVVVTDQAKRSALADIYRRAFEAYRSMDLAGIGKLDPTSDIAQTQARVVSSAQHLADHLAEVPVHVIPCLEGRLDGVPSFFSASMWGSLFPAAWSFMLAARERGLGTTWTTLHLMHEEEAADVLGIPFASVSQGLLIPLAYTVGTDFKAAPRNDAADRVHVDGW